jgi:phage terminase large subunit-like protein
MSALVLIAEDLEGVFHVEPWFWLPGNVQERESEDRAPYQGWIEDGYLISIGEATDPKVIALKIAELDGQYRIQTLAYDRWRIGDLKRELDAIGCTVKLVPHGQGFKDMSPAVDILESADHPAAHPPRQSPGACHERGERCRDPRCCRRPEAR